MQTECSRYIGYLVHGADGADAAEDTWPAPGGVTVIGLRALAERLARKT